MKINKLSSGKILNIDMVLFRLDSGMIPNGFDNILKYS